MARVCRISTQLDQLEARLIIFFQVGPTLGKTWPTSVEVGRHLAPGATLELAGIAEGSFPERGKQLSDNFHVSRFSLPSPASPGLRPSQAQVSLDIEELSKRHAFPEGQYSSLGSASGSAGGSAPGGSLNSSGFWRTAERNMAPQRHICSTRGRQDVVARASGFAFLQNAGTFVMGVFPNP